MEHCLGNQKSSILSFNSSLLWHSEIHCCVQKSVCKILYKPFYFTLSNCHSGRMFQGVCEYRFASNHHNRMPPFPLAIWGRGCDLDSNDIRIYFCYPHYGLKTKLDSYYGYAHDPVTVGESILYIFINPFVYAVVTLRLRSHQIIASVLGKNILYKSNAITGNQN